ncbi:MAG: NAD+ synthase [Chloroflexi bacterium]|nr:NAD+ synthase [Chloroflexota bacterium]
MREKLQINTSLVREVLLRFIHDEVTRTGLTKGIVGLSGGIDSSLIAYLAAEALGPASVLGVRMPYRRSSQESLDHAQLVTDALGIQQETVDITPMVDPLIERFPEMDQVRSGNIMSRQRMIILYDQSAAFGGLVIGTSNKTEALLGYSTLFGDSAAAMQPIADLYKMQVRQLAREMGVPPEIINKPPSADLWPGQTDEDEIGFSYDNADQLLFAIIDLRYSPEEAVKMGFPQAFVERVLTLVRRSHYKRRMPIIAKLSNRSIGHDFLYLRDWGT